MRANERRRRSRGRTARRGRVVRYARMAQEQRLLSSADCKWTQLRKPQHWYCLANRRTYRLSPTKDNAWNLYRVDSTSEDEKGALIGKYQRRGDATKVVGEIAYQPEPKWQGGLTLYLLTCGEPRVSHRDGRGYLAVTVSVLHRGALPFKPVHRSA
jgi:hypothetical protein